MTVDNINQHLSLDEHEIIKEEERNLSHLKELETGVSVIDNRDELLQQIFELRENLAEASMDDVGPLTEQISRLTQLINQGDRSSAMGIDQGNPYFAHVRLEEENITRDFYIGTQVYLSADKKIQIVDWKASPISMLYFRYDEGEDYEEKLGDQWIEGVVVFKRILKVQRGELIRIQQGKNIYEKQPDLSWIKKDLLVNELHGGSGVATRATHSQSGSPNLQGVGAGTELKKRYLPEITSLIDENQFALITKPETSVVAIQGTAGSGKTTVALHRVAWLHFQDKRRFLASTMMVMVFNKALANYISQLLPSLGIKNVGIDFYEQWAANQRGRLFSGSLPRKYAENTPVSVIRVKKHPALLHIINNFVSNKNQQLNGRIKNLVQRKSLKDFPLESLYKLSFINRLFRIYNWSIGKERGRLSRPLSAEVVSILGRIVNEFIDPHNSKKVVLIQLWEELFSDFEGLKQGFRETAADEITDNVLDDALKWMKNQYIDLQEFYAEKGNRSDTASPATLDYEDDPILLLMYQKFQDDLPKANGKPIKYSHLMIDEAQDLSPIEMTTLLGVSKTPHSITLAGDVNQQMIRYNGFKSWNFMFDYLGLEGQELSSLNISYRSTRQIMQFAMDLLDHQSEETEVKTTREGPPVELFNFDHQGELTNFLATNLKGLMMDEPNASIAVICFSPEAALQYFTMLEHMEIPRLRLIDDQNFTFTAGIDITDIKQVKGLEFDYVVLLDVDAVNYSKNSYTRYLLHIGATRAAHQLWIMNYRVNSPLLPGYIAPRSG
ncbi:MAG: UvrD-helicase domain-containing protein [Proteobacteria bacterium]|nr:UvrD-helicase domain-containing protein [Pseudomonadota bacterium]